MKIYTILYYFTRKKTQIGYFIDIYTFGRFVYIIRNDSYK